MTQPQQEYIITDNQLDILERVSVSGYSNVFRNIRSRRHTPIDLKACFDDCVIDGNPFEVYRQDAGMGEHDYCVMLRGNFYCRTDNLDSAKEIIHAVLSPTRPHTCTPGINIACRLPEEEEERIRNATINEFYRRIKAERDPSLEYVDWDSVEAAVIRLRGGVK